MIERETSWIACSDRHPDENVPVWLWDGARMWIGTHEHADEGWHYTCCYVLPDYVGPGWKTLDAEWDDDYQPTHWTPLPTNAPKAKGGGR